MSFRRTFEQVVAHREGAPYLTFYDGEGRRSAWSYRDFAADALRTAALLRQRGVGLSGRMKELIIRGGVNLSPLEIDEALRDCPGVAFALAFPFENSYYGEEVALYVVPEKGMALREEEVLSYAETKLPFAKRPKVVLFGEEVPYTTTGKPKRLELAQRLAEDLKPFRSTQFRE